MSGVRTRGYHPKIYAMLQGMELRQQIKEEQAENWRKLVEENKKDFWDAVYDLRDIFPGFAEWWDNSGKIPLLFHWTGKEYEKLMDIVRNKTEEVKNGGR